MRIVRVGAVALVVSLGMGAAACGSSGGSSGGSGTKTTSTAPEEGRTTDAKVALGLGKINATAVAITAAAAVDKDKAAGLADKIEPDWQPIEGTVKANSADTYLAFEDAFAVLEKAAKDGDPTKAASATKTIAATSADYLKDHPGL